jgi:hypothetical protein
MDMRFSQRHGYTPIKSVVQIEDIDDQLRNGLWSTLKVHYWDKIRPRTLSEMLEFGRGHSLASPANEGIATLCRALWINFFKYALDTLPDNWEEAYGRLRQFFFSCNWFEVYDFVEFVPQWYPDQKLAGLFMHTANALLEREVSAYRFVDKRIVRIVTPEEIDAVEAAVKIKVGPVREHLDQAVKLLSDRRSPDYRNSIKESISAVEALVRSVTDSDKGTLGDLLKRLGRDSPIHPALEGAFSKLYGYTSDADGIRHALLDEDRVTFEQAKFMLVACSAFANYVNGLLKS